MMEELKMSPDRIVSSLPSWPNPQQPEGQDQAAPSSSGSMPSVGTQPRPTPPAGIPARPASPQADPSTHSNKRLRRASVPVFAAQASMASPSSAQTSTPPTELPGGLPPELWLDVVGRTNQDTWSAFRLVSPAAAAVGAKFVQGLKVKNSQELAQALEAYKSADIAKLELDGSDFNDADLQSLPPSLRELSLIGGEITAAGWAHLNNLPRLESLKIAGLSYRG
jgi:hypothetical protein